MKAVLISIQPKWCELIASGKKTIEVRKSKPTVEMPFKCYIYCTAGTTLYVVGGRSTGKRIRPQSIIGNRKVIGEFVCDRIEEFHEWQLTPYGKFRDSEEEDLQKFLKDSCLSLDEVFAYRENLEYYQPLYNWHISELEIYDKPKELSEFLKPCKWRSANHGCFGYECEAPSHKVGCQYAIADRNPDWSVNVYMCCYKDYVTRPPQSWCYVEEM